MNFLNKYLALKLNGQIEHGYRGYAYIYDLHNKLHIKLY